MATRLTRPTFQEDVDLLGRSNQLYEAREAAANRPVDYSRLGGAALGRRGDMYGSFLRASGNIGGGLADARLGREIASRRAQLEKEVLAEKMRNKQIAQLVDAGVGFGADYIAHQAGRDNFSLGPDSYWWMDKP